MFYLLKHLFKKIYHVKNYLSLSPLLISVLLITPVLPVFGQAELVEDVFSSDLNPSNHIYKLSFQDEEFVIFAAGEVLAHNTEWTLTTGIPSLNDVDGQISVEYDGHLIFSTGDNLVSYDGEQFNTIFGDGYDYIGHLQVYDDGNGPKLYFYAYDPDDHESYIWSYDGSEFEKVPELEDNSLIQMRSINNDSQGKLYLLNWDFDVISYDGEEVLHVNKELDGEASNLFKFNNGSEEQLYFIETEQGDSYIYDSDGNEVAKISDEIIEEPLELITYDDGNGPKMYFSTPRKLLSFDGDTVEVIENQIGESAYLGYSLDYFQIYNDKLFFTAEIDDADYHYALLSYDGDGILVEEKFDHGDAGYKIRHLTKLSTDKGEELVFRGGYDKGFTSHPYELWSFKNGDATLLREDLEVQLQAMEELYTVGPNLFALYSETDSRNAALVRYDGTDVIFENTDNNYSSKGSRITMEDNVIYGGDLYYTGYIDSLGQDVLMKYDGDTTSILLEYTDADDFTVYDDGSGPKLYFSTSNSLVSYDSSTGNFNEIMIENGNSYYAGGLIVYDDGSGAKLYFRSRAGEYGAELWSYDGSEAKLIEDIQAGEEGSWPERFTVYDDGSGSKLFFMADDGSHGEELWAYDGEETELVFDLYNGSSSSSPRNLTVYDDGMTNKLYFTALSDKWEDRKILAFRAGDTTHVDLPDYNNSYIGGVFDDGSEEKLVLNVNTKSPEAALWFYDGTSVTTRVDLPEVGSYWTESNSPRNFYTLNNELYFTMYSSEIGREPYVYNPDTENITSYDMNPGEYSGYGSNPIVYNDGSGAELYIAGNNGKNGYELYRIGPNDEPFSGKGTSNEFDYKERPNTVSLSQNYPNPFNPITQISYDLVEASEVSLKVYNILGQQVAILVQRHQSAGSYTVSFDASNLSSGTYIYRLEVGDYMESRAMTLIK